MVLYPWKTTTPKRLLHVKLIEPPYTERYVRWCERSEGEIIAFLLLDLISGPWTQGMYISGPVLKKAHGTNGEVVWFRRQKQGRLIRP